LSIKPEFVEKIFDGTKRYEYRKIQFKQTSVRTVVVYSTQPVGQIVGEFDIDEILCDEPLALWETTHDGAGIDAAFFGQYFLGRERAVAIKIGSTRLYDPPLDPNDLFENFVAPQSFRYISEFTDVPAPARATATPSPPA
jgi:predicted transcriptional regulator